MNKKLGMEIDKEASNLIRIYKNAFESENGRIILDDLKNEILNKTPFHTDNLRDDALLREGARLLLNYIYHVIESEN
jgi:hypothetical protein